MVPPHASTRCMPLWMWRSENHRISRSKPKNFTEFVSFHGNVFQKKNNSKSTSRWMLGRWSFPFGVLPGRCELFSFRECKTSSILASLHQHFEKWKVYELHLEMRSLMRILSCLATGILGMEGGGMNIWNIFGEISTPILFLYINKKHTKHTPPKFNSKSHWKMMEKGDFLLFFYGFNGLAFRVEPLVLRSGVARGDVDFFLEKDWVCHIFEEAELE